MSTKILYITRPSSSRGLWKVSKPLERSFFALSTILSWLGHCLFFYSFLCVKGIFTAFSAQSYKPPPFLERSYTRSHLSYPSVIHYLPLHQKILSPWYSTLYLVLCKKWTLQDLNFSKQFCLLLGSVQCLASLFIKVYRLQRHKSKI